MSLHHMGTLEQDHWLALVCLKKKKKKKKKKFFFTLRGPAESDALLAGTGDF